MFNTDAVTEEDARFFDGGYNCAESIFLAFSRVYGVESPIIPRVV